MTAKVHRWSLETRIQTFLEAKAKDARQSSRRPPNQVALALVAAGNPDASIDRARLKFDVAVNPDIRLALSRSSASEHTEQSLPSVTMSGRQTTCREQCGGPQIRDSCKTQRRRAMVDIGHGSSALVELELDVLLTT